jgi:UDP-GlcNAc:undecaprenyl-phosphate GlcNAc-1-phosphate transferase
MSPHNGSALSTALIAFLIAFLASVILTIPARWLALRIGMVDIPNSRKLHSEPMPLLGGLAIYLGFVLAILVVLRLPTSSQITGILAGATILAAVGILDDRGLLHHQIKLLIAMPCAALILLLVGLRAEVFAHLLAGRAGLLLDSALTIFWVVGITAAFSILDHMDGLCAGVAAVAAIFFVIAATITGQVLVCTLAAAALGAALGFLIWNFNPARIFMGDGGAMMLGFLMAALSLKLCDGISGAFPTASADLPSPVFSASLVAILILGVPVFDTTLVSISRGRRGLLPFATPGKDHTAHRLRNLGLTTRQAVLVMCSLGIFFGTLGLIVLQSSRQIATGMAVALATLILIGVVCLERAPYERQRKS